MCLKDNTNPFIHVNPPYQLMVIHSSKLVYPRELYQRGVERKRVELIAAHFNEYEQLPITLTADHVAAALGISRANAYILLRSDGFPTLHIGKRMVVPKDRFLQWITDSVNG